MKNTSRNTLRVVAVAVLLMSIPLCLVFLHGQNRQSPNPYNIVSKDLNERDRLREARDGMRQILDLAGVRPGMVVGEAGAGDGYFTLMLAERVGPAGKVIANDIEREALESLKQRARGRNLSNIETALGTEDDPRFPDVRLDMIFVINSFHDFERPVEMLRSMAPSLKREGTLNIVEYRAVAAAKGERAAPKEQVFLDNTAKGGFVVEKTARVNVAASEDFSPVLYVLSQRRS